MSKTESWLNTPASSEIQPPVETRQQLLPFEELAWEDFEKLCYRLVRLEASVEFCEQYGTGGSAQEGIDIYARVTGSEKYRCYQCKNEADFGPAKIKDAVEIFQGGEWVGKSDTFVLCTRESLRSTTERTKEFERQAQALKSQGVTLISWDAEELSSKLKSHPELVDDFFGRPWVKAFCGDEFAVGLGQRLDSKEIKRLRSQLFSLYCRIFNRHDRGIPLPGVLPLEERYVLPDIEDLQIIESTSQATSVEKSSSNTESSASSEEDRGRSMQKIGVRQYTQRIPIQNWVTRSRKSLLFGDPGSGKSTFLRYLALDLLSDKPALDSVSEKWGTFIPVWVPFALWTKVVSDGSAADRSVKGIVTAFLKSWDGDEILPLVEKALKDKRLLLLFDGLDENSSTESARIALNHLESFLDDNNSHVVVTTRPHGFERLGMKLDGWQQAKIADFSMPQQKELVNIWFQSNSKKINPDLDEPTRNRDVKHQASIFFAELERSNELKELARNPLLLCLLISFQISNIRLPLGRFVAYEALTDHLLLAHPERRRVAAEAPASSPSLSENDLKKALAYLADYIHREHQEGLILESKAEQVLVCFLMDDQQGFGMERHPATEMARNILRNAEYNLGILVKRSQDEISFYHKTMQEYLVSFNISRLSSETQIDIVRSRCTETSWREVILGLLQITKRPDEVRKMIESIQSRNLNLVEQKMVEDLFAEIAFGNFNCPPNLAKELARQSFTQIEIGTWMPHREQILSHVLDGLRSPILSEIVRAKIREWFPDQAEWSTSTIFEAMSGWSSSPELVDVLFKGINAEEYRVKLAAATTLASVSEGDSEIVEKLFKVANYSDDLYAAAAALHALLLGWKDHPSLPGLVERSANSNLPALKILGIKGRINFNKHTEKDLKALIKLADRDARIHWGHRNEIADLLLEGWSGNEKIRRICLESSRRDWGRNGIDKEIALFVLLAGYPMDPKVVSFCVDEITNDKYPFVALDRHNAFRLLAQNFKDQPDIVRALDGWLEKTEHMDMDVASVALVGRTPAFKKRLLEDVKKNSWPHWPAGALIDGWGLDDEEVKSAFQEILNSGPRKISAVGHLLPQIITDREECRELLINTLKHPDCGRHDFVLDGLILLGTSEKDKEIVDIALDVISKDLIKGFLIDGFKADLIRKYGFDPRVKELAKSILDERDEVYWATAEAYGDDQGIRKRILQIVTPLPTPLRQVISDYLSNGEIDEDFALSILELYDHEKDREVKVQSAIGYYTRLKNSGKDQTTALKKLADTIVCGGPDHYERRQAAFCGLTILARLDVMNEVKDKYDSAGAPVAITSIQGVDVNVPHIRFLLQNWRKIKDFFKEGFWDRVFGHSSGHYLWNSLARFADEYPEPKEEALEFFSKPQPRVGQAETLRFLSRVQPGSTLLFEYCINTLGLNEPSPGHPRTHGSDLHVTPRDGLVAAEILADSFSSDKDFPQRIYTERNRYQINVMVEVLSEGWPESPELDQCFKEMARFRRGYWESSILRYHAFKSDQIRMYRELIRLIRTWSSVPRYRINEMVVRPLIRRLQKDDRLMVYLIKHLTSIATPSQKVSLIRLFFKAKGLTPELKNWTEKELIYQFSGSGVEAGYDITTGEFISVPHIIFETMLKRN